MPPSGAVFFLHYFQEVAKVDNGRIYIDRLLSCGYTEENALDTCYSYAASEDWDGLESYVRTAESIYKEEI